MTYQPISFGKIMSKANRLKLKRAEIIKLDLGCGPNPKEDFLGIDIIDFGKNRVLDLRKPNWPWPDNSVTEIWSSHFVEHLTAYERVIFANEVYRILIPDGSCQIITPHWASCRAYGDPTHVWPPVSEFWFYYLDREWRAINAPHTDIKHNPQGFNCHLGVTWGYGLRQDILTKNEQAQMFAMQNYKDACEDIIATMKRKD